MNLKEKLQRNIPTIGSWITLGHSSVAEVMTQSKYDWLTIDMEHSAISLGQAQDLIRVIQHAGTVPLVRVGENNANTIKRVMDAGAGGVIVPMVNSPEEAKAAVEAVKYPPFGKRGVGLARAQSYGFGFEEYKAWNADESIVIVQIEHINAIRNLRSILEVPGVDGSIIGPYDLSGSLGYPGEFQRAEVQEALSEYERVCLEMNKPRGFHVVQLEENRIKDIYQKGYTFVAVGLDTLYLGEKSRQIVSFGRKNMVEG